MADVADQPGRGDERLAASARALAEAGDAPSTLSAPFTLGPPLPDMAGHPELAAAHRGWVAVEGETGDAPRRGGGPRAALARVALGALRRHPEYRHQRDLLAQLTRVVDALAKRCDELDRRLGTLHDHVGEVSAVLSEDVTRLAAMVASGRPPPPGSVPPADA